MIDKRKQILVVAVGPSPILSQDGSVITVRNKKNLTPWMEELRELRMIADVEGLWIPLNDTSSAVEHWQRMINALHKPLEQYDGMVLLHPAATMIETGTALSFALQHLSLPLVFVGTPDVGTGVARARHSVKAVRQYGIRSTLINATQIASIGVPGVMLATGERILQANQAVRSLRHGQTVIDSIGSDIAHVDFGVRVLRVLLKPTKALAIRPTFARVHVLRAFPSIQPDAVAAALASDTDGVLLIAESMDTIETIRMGVSARAKPLVAYVTVAPERKGRSAITVLANMTETAAIVKTMWVLANARDAAQRRKLFEENSAGERVMEVL